MIKNVFGFLCILFFIPFLNVGCANYSPANEAALPDLEGWIGEYQFDEFSEPNINMHYSILIYEEDSSYWANISVDGFQTSVRARGSVTGDEKTLEIILDEYLPENLSSIFEPGDILLNFLIVESSIQTEWGKLQPALFENAEVGDHFQKVR